MVNMPDLFAYSHLPIRMSAPLPHVQYFEKALKIEPLLSYAEKVFKEPVSDSRYF